MKYLLSLFCLFLCGLFAESQGTITSFSMSPVNPTSSDTIYIYANLQFSSGDCELENLSHSLSGMTIQANTHHCIGALAVICNTIDTFKIDPLSPGNYDFILSLTSGSGPVPCTPGIVEDDTDTLNFNINADTTANINKFKTASFESYPNPIEDHIKLPSTIDGTAYSLVSLSGQVIKSGTLQSNIISGLESLPSGFYLLKLNSENGLLVKQIVKL